MHIGPIKNVLLLGGGDLLRKIALSVSKKNIEVKVITAPRHANEIINGISLKEFLRKNKIEFIEIKELTKKRITGFVLISENTFSLSLGAAWIFKNDIIEKIFNGRLMNLHGSRLPQNRGAGTFSWPILMGNRFGFCQLHLINSEKIDCGQIVDEEEFLYPAICRIPIDYMNYYNSMNLNFINKFIDKHSRHKSKINLLNQQEYFSTYWPRISSDVHSWIDWSMDSSNLEKFICAFDDPYKGAQSMLNGKKCYLKSVCLASQDGKFHPFQSGLIYRKGKSWVCISVNDNTLIVEKVLDKQGKNIIDKLKIGDRFTTPPEKLNNAYIERVVLTPTGKK